MPATILMIVLTLGADDGLSAAFVDTASIPECRQRAATVRTILEGNTEVADTICLPSAQRFEPFTHDTGDMPRHAYLIAHDGRRATIRPVAGCDGVTPAAGTICATSAQAMLDAD